jgi:hypothetical protein
MSTAVAKDVLPGRWRGHRRDGAAGAVAAVGSCRPGRRAGAPDGDSAPGAFDDAADFRRNDGFDRRAVLSRIPLRIDCGIADPFHTAARSFAAGLDPQPITGLGAGDHSQGYWRRKAPKPINFIGKLLDGH